MTKFKTPRMSNEEWREVSRGLKHRVSKSKGHMTMEKLRKMYRQEVKKVTK